MLGGLLYDDPGCLLTNRGPAALPRQSRLGLGARLAPGSGARSGPYMQAWDAIVPDAGKPAVLRLLDTADAAAAGS